MQHLYAFIYFLILMLSIGCTPLEILNGSVSNDGYKSNLDQLYASKPRHKLDIHTPNQVKNNTDVVIFFYGGRWQSGNKKDYTFVADAFTSNGVITVIPDYRLYPIVDWRDIIKDAAKAYQWVYENIQRYNGNPERIFIMGHSAGAHIAAMVAVDDSLLNTRTKRPCGFIGLAGPYDFLPIRDADVKQVFSTADDITDTQPINYINEAEPPMLLLHGLDDTSVKPGNSVRMGKRMKKVDGLAEIKLYKDIDHIDLLISLSSTFRHVSPALKDSVTFINNTSCH